jgi:hypothetical protein
MSDSAAIPVTNQLMQLHDDELLQFQKLSPETGMGFYVAKGVAGGAYAMLSDGTALPLQTDLQYFDLPTLVAGTPLPQLRQPAMITEVNLTHLRGPCLR